LVVEAALGVLDTVADDCELCWAKAQSVLPPARIAARQRKPIKRNIHVFFVFFVFVLNRMSSGEQFQGRAVPGKVDDAGMECRETVGSIKQETSQPSWRNSGIDATILLSCPK
jgi:hypothetical protein